MTIVENRMATPTCTFSLVVWSRSRDFGLVLRNPSAEPNQGDSEKTNIKIQGLRGGVELGCAHPVAYRGSEFDQIRVVDHQNEYRHG